MVKYSVLECVAVFLAEKTPVPKGSLLVEIPLAVQHRAKEPDPYCGDAYGFDGTHSPLEWSGQVR